MTPLSFKNRIAFNYIITTALLICVLFFMIYSIVKFSVYSHINFDIKSESKKHLTEIKIEGNRFFLTHLNEWKEREHNTVDVNPVFVQFVDSLGKIVEKSPNLKILTLQFHPEIINKVLFDTKLSNKSIRQIQVAIYNNDVIIGHLIVAMSVEPAEMVLKNLSNVLLVSFPIILLLLFLIARFIAGRSIKPINSIIATSNIITKDNLKSRIPLPQNRDELYVLSQTINDLLDRIETTIDREKQFTADASHELRTPLTVIKGTLEVLIRKPRTQPEYEEKVNFCISEVNRLNFLVDQLLLLARFENQNKSLKIEKIFLNAFILDAVSRFSDTIYSKKIQVKTEFSKEYFVNSDPYFLSIISSNILSNALKYSNTNGFLLIDIKEVGSKIECCIVDSGLGIPSEDLPKIFNKFYRSKSNIDADIKGIGLGLSIVQRLCGLLAIDISISSEEGLGTKVKLIFQ